MLTSVESVNKVKLFITMATAYTVYGMFQWPIERSTSHREYSVKLVQNFSLKTLHRFFYAASVPKKNLAALRQRFCLTMHLHRVNRIGKPSELSVPP